METIVLHDKSVISIKLIFCIISVALLFAVSWLILPVNAYSSSVKNIQPNTKDIQKPAIPKPIKKKGIVKPAAKPFLEIKKVYVSPKDKKLRVVIQNTGGGDLSRSDYFSGKLEIRLLGTVTKWWWPLAKIKSRGNHFVTETTFNTNKVLTQPVKIRVDIKGVRAGKPWIGTLLEDRKARKKAASVKQSSKVKIILQQPNMQIDPKAKQKIKIQIPSGLPDMIPRSGSPPYITIENVYRHTQTGNLHVVMQNSGREDLNSSSYPIYGLHITGLGRYMQNWSFEQLDVDHTLMGNSLDFDTGLPPLTTDETIVIYFSGVSGDRFEGVPGNCAVGDFRIISPAVGLYTRYDRPLEISWIIPAVFDNGEDSQPAATFKVELLKNGRTIAQVESNRYTYDSSSKLCTLFWAIPHYIVTGSDYKIKVTLRPINQYEYGGNLTASMPGEFKIDTASSRGSSNGFNIHNPLVGQRYAIGDRVEIIYSWSPDPSNTNLAGYTPQMVKITLFRVDGNTSRSLSQWVEYVPEPITLAISDGGSGILPPRLVYINTITIPNRGYNNAQLIPGTYYIQIKDANGGYAHHSGSNSGFFTIYDDNKQHVHGIKDGLIDDPFEIVSPGVPVEHWNLENEQSIEWQFDPDLEIVNFSVSIDMSLNGGDIYYLIQDNIEILPKGKAVARFTLPRNFNLGRISFEKYANIKIMAPLPGGRVINTARTVIIGKTIEIQNVNDRFSINSTYRLRWVISKFDIGRIGVALKKAGRIIKILDPSRASGQGYNELNWCVLCDTTEAEQSELAGSGYTIRVYSIENHNIYDESTTFAIME